MAITKSTMAKPPVNVDKLKFWVMTDEENETYSSKGYDLTKRVMSFSSSITTNTTQLDGSGVLVDVAVGTGTGTVTYGVHELLDEERAAIYGYKIENDVVITTGDEVPPAVCVAHTTVRNDGKINLYKYLKVRFAPNSETVQQISNGTKNFSTIEISGTYAKNQTVGVMCAVVRGVDPVANKAFFDKWFTDPSFIGEAE